jgi:hypothetical protein
LRQQRHLAPVPREHHRLTLHARLRPVAECLRVVTGKQFDDVAPRVFAIDQLVGAARDEGEGRYAALAASLDDAFAEVVDIGRGERMSLARLATFDREERARWRNYVAIAKIVPQ